MSGAPTYVQSVPQYAGNYAAPQNQAYPGYGYSGPPPQQPQNIDLGKLISDNKTQLAELKKLQRAKKRAEDDIRGISTSREDPGVLRVGEDDEDEYSPYEHLDITELEKLKQQLKPGPERALIQELIDEKMYVDDQLDVEELGEEIDQLEFWGVRVWDPNEEIWLPAESRGLFDDTQSLIRSMQKRFPFATKIKWGAVKKNKRRIDALSDKSYTIQSTAESQLKFARAQHEAINEGVKDRQQVISTQPSGFSGTDMAALITAVNESASKQQTMMFELIKAMKSDTPPKESPMKDLALMKDIFLTPQIEMVKAMQPKSSGAIDPMQLFNTMMSGAKTLASMGGGGGGGGEGSGLISMLMQYLPSLMQQFQNGMTAQQNPPVQTAPQQQLAYSPPQRQTAPPQAPVQKGTQVEQPAIAALRARSKKIIENLLSKKLTLDNVPRYIWRNGTQPEGQALMTMSLDDFKRILLGSVNSSDPTIRAFIQNPDVVKGAQWIYEEFHRLWTICSICAKNGDEKQAESLISWQAGPLIETNLIGQQAHDEFMRRYEITPEDLGLQGEEDLPGDEIEESEDLPKVLPTSRPSGQPSGGKSVPTNKIDNRVVEPKSSTRPKVVVPTVEQNEAHVPADKRITEKIEERVEETDQNPRPRVKKRPSFM